ncbi:unnamed protein product [Calypogeia fissa]
MLACLSPACAKTAGNRNGNGMCLPEGKPKAEEKPSKNGNGSFFTCQFKQMASRLAGGSLSKYCKPGCGMGAPNEVHDENFSVNPAPVEMHSPQFSLKSYQMNGRTPPRQDLLMRDSENQFDPAQASPRALRSLHKNFGDAAPVRREEEGNADHGGSGYKVYSTEWVAQVEPGVYITFCTAPDGFNDLKRIKFSRAMFSKQHAENWWTEYCPRVRALYNVRPPSSTATDDDRFSSGYATPDAYSKSPCSSYGEDYLLTRRKSSADARLKDSDSEAGGTGGGNSWIEQDETGVYLTIITVPGVGKQLKRVRFSRDKFSEGEAAAWWEHNRQRIYAQYIFTNTRLQGK